MARLGKVKKRQVNINAMMSCKACMYYSEMSYQVSETRQDVGMARQIVLKQVMKRIIEERNAKFNWEKELINKVIQTPYGSYKIVQGDYDKYYYMYTDYVNFTDDLVIKYGERNIDVKEINYKSNIVNDTKSNYERIFIVKDNLYILNFGDSVTLNQQMFDALCFLQHRNNIKYKRNKNLQIYLVNFTTKMPTRLQQSTVIKKIDSKVILDSFEKAIVEHYRTSLAPEPPEPTPSKHCRTADCLYLCPKRKDVIDKLNVTMTEEIERALRKFIDNIPKTMI